MVRPHIAIIVGSNRRDSINGGQLVAMAGERMKFDGSQKSQRCVHIQITVGAGFHPCSLVQ
jgi:hypothetical protein